MNVLILIWLGTFIIADVAAQREDAFIAKALDMSFENKACIYLIAESSEFIDYFNVIFAQANVSVLIRKSVEDARSCKPTGYLFIYNHFENLKKAFNRNMLPHKRVVIVYGGERSFQVKPFTTMAHLHGLDIITIQCIIVFNSALWILQFGIRSIFITSVNRNRVIVKWNKSVDFGLETKDFKLENWNPTFEDTKFKVSVFDCRPYVYYDEKNGVYNGIEKYMIEEITKSWPLDYVVHRKYSWHEVLQFVSESKSDASICSTWQMTTSNMGLDQSYPYTQICATFFVPKPQNLPFATYVFQPFDIYLWSLLCFLILGISYSLQATAKFYENYYPDFSKNHYLDYVMCVIFTIRVFTAGGIAISPSSSKNALRFLIILWCICSVLINTGYSAGFTSILAYPRLSEPINTLQDMIKQGVYWGETNEDTLNSLLTSDNEDIVGLTNRFILQTSIDARNEAIQNKNFGFSTKISGNEFVSEVDTLDKFGERNLKVLSECIGEYFIVVALGKNSPFTKIFDKAINRFVEHGFIMHWYKTTKYRDYSSFKHMPRYFSTYSDDIPSYSDIDIERMQGIFYCLFLGYAISICTLLCEIVYEQWRQPNFIL